MGSRLQLDRTELERQGSRSDVPRGCTTHRDAGGGGLTSPAPRHRSDEAPLKARGSWDVSVVAGRAGLGVTGGHGPALGHPPLHGQGLPQERREDSLLVVVGQQEDALDQEVPHLPVVHHGQVHQDGAQDLGHLGVGDGHHRAARPSGAPCPPPAAHPSSCPSGLWAG